MRKIFLKFLIKFIPTSSRNFNRLVRKFNILYNSDKVKNKYRLFDICGKFSDCCTNYTQLNTAQELLSKTYSI